MMRFIEIGLFALGVHSPHRRLDEVGDVDTMRVLGHFES